MEPKDIQDITHRFGHHILDDVNSAICEEIRRRAGELALFLNEVCDSGRELSVALTKLEEAMFWANASIARETWSK